MIYLTIALCIALAAMATLLFRMAFFLTAASKLLATLDKAADLSNTGEALRNEALNYQVRSARIVSEMLAMQQAAVTTRKGANACAAAATPWSRVTT